VAKDENEDDEEDEDDEDAEDADGDENDGLDKNNEVARMMRMSWPWPRLIASTRISTRPAWMACKPCMQ